MYYGRTEGERGYKEYGAVIVVTKVLDIKYGYDLYSPWSGCVYKIIKEISDNTLKQYFSIEIDSVRWIADPKIIGNVS